MLTIQFWKGAGERALKTFLQTTFASLLAVAGGAVTAWDVPWVTTVYDAAGVGLLAALLSLFTSVGNADFTAGVPNVQVVPVDVEPVVDSVADIAGGDVLDAHEEEADADDI